MTPKRKAEVNCLLGDFEHGDWREEYTDYVGDLNALARLGAKLPRHHWCIYVGGDKGPSAELEFDDWVMDYQDSTEAEARAEALAHYLKRRRVD